MFLATRPNPDLQRRAIKGCAPPLPSPSGSPSPVGNLLHVNTHPLQRTQEPQMALLLHEMHSGMHGEQ